MSRFISQAILTLNPNIRANITGETYESIQWLSGESIEESLLMDLVQKLKEEVPLNALRKQRDRIIAESDWRMTIDYAGTDQEEWKTYRQALRDITNTYTSLDDVVWPDEP